MGLIRILRSQTIGGIANWSGLFTTVLSLSFVGAALTWAASAWDTVYGHGWGAAVFAGLAALCVLVFFLSMAAVAWRIYRPMLPQIPIKSDDASETLNGSKITLDGSRLSDLEETVKRLTSLHIDAISKNGFAHDKIIEKQNALRDELNDVAALLAPEPAPMGLLAVLGMPDRPPAKNRFESIDNKIADFREQATGRSDGIKRTVEELKKMIDSVRESVENLADYTKNMFRAQRIAELYDRSLIDLDMMSSRLDDPLLKPEIFSDWRTWTESFDEYKSKLRNICRLVSPYISIEDPVFETPNEKFKSKYWRYDFGSMTDDQKHDYKTYRIIRENFNERREDVATAINAKLYASL